MEEGRRGEEVQLNGYDQRSVLKTDKIKSKYAFANLEYFRN